MDIYNDTNSINDKGIISLYIYPHGCYICSVYIFKQYWYLWLFLRVVGMCSEYNLSKWGWSVLNLTLLKISLTHFVGWTTVWVSFLPFTFTRAKSLASMTVPWKNSTCVKCLFSKPSNSRSGRILQRVEPRSIHVSVCH